MKRSDAIVTLLRNKKFADVLKSVEEAGAVDLKGKITEREANNLLARMEAAVDGHPGCGADDLESLDPRIMWIAAYCNQKVELDEVEAPVVEAPTETDLRDAPSVAPTIPADVTKVDPGQTPSESGTADVTGQPVAPGQVTPPPE